MTTARARIRGRSADKRIQFTDEPTVAAQTPNVNALCPILEMRSHCQDCLEQFQRSLDKILQCWQLVRSHVFVFLETNVRLSGWLLFF